MFHYSAENPVAGAKKTQELAKEGLNIYQILDKIARSIMAPTKDFLQTISFKKSLQDYRVQDAAKIPSIASILPLVIEADSGWEGQDYPLIHPAFNPKILPNCRLQIPSKSHFSVALEAYIEEVGYVARLVAGYQSYLAEAAEACVQTDPITRVLVPFIAAHWRYTQDMQHVLCDFFKKAHQNVGVQPEQDLQLFMQDYEDSVYMLSFKDCCRWLDASNCVMPSAQEGACREIVYYEQLADLYREILEEIDDKETTVASVSDTLEEKLGSLLSVVVPTATPVSLKDLDFFKVLLQQLSPSPHAKKSTDACAFVETVRTEPAAFRALECLRKGKALAAQEALPLVKIARDYLGAACDSHAASWAAYTQACKTRLRLQAKHLESLASPGILQRHELAAALLDKRDPKSRGTGVSAPAPSPEPQTTSRP